MGKYSASASTADSLIKRKGATVVLTRKGVTSFNPVTQQETSTTTTYSFKAVVEPPAKGEEFEVDSLGRKNAIKITFAQKGQSIEPRPGDQINWKGENWTLFWASTLDPAGDGAVLTTAYAER